MVTDRLIRLLILVKHEYFITILELVKKSGELVLKKLN